MACDKDLKTIPTLKNRDALTTPDSPINAAAMADVEALVECWPSCPEMPDDEKDWTIVDLVEVGTERKSE